jgi:hypothetical protein
MSSRTCRTAQPIPMACSDKFGSHQLQRLARDQRAHCPTDQAERDGYRVSVWAFGSRNSAWPASELIKPRGPWRGVEQVEIAALE